MDLNEKDNYLMDIFKSKKVVEEHNRRMNKQQLRRCPFTYYEWDADNWKAMKSKVTVDCSLGHGEWCKNCSHFRRHKYQKGGNKDTYEKAKIRRLEKMHKSGKVPWKRKKINPARYVCPVDL